MVVHDAMQLNKHITDKKPIGGLLISVSEMAMQLETANLTAQAGCSCIVTIFSPHFSVLTALLVHHLKLGGEVTHGHEHASPL